MRSTREQLEVESSPAYTILVKKYSEILGSDAGSRIKKFEDIMSGRIYVSSIYLVQ